MDNTVLILAPHTDDGELGCGGTIARFLEEGKKVYYVAFSSCEASVPECESKNILRIELMKAMKSFGIPDENVHILNYPVRKFQDFRQNILDDILKIDREIVPSLIFTPSVRDVHQDHYVIAKEAMRAFKKRTLLAYEAPWNNFEFKNQAYYKLEKRHIDAKHKALECYETQKGRPYTAKEFTYGQAKMRGVQIGCEYAEVFEVVRLVI